jgi:hypothetical protein
LKWDNCGNPIPQTIEEQKLEKLQITLSQTKVSTQLVQKEVFTAHKTLGTRKCIVGKEKEHYEFLEDKSNKLAALTIRSQMNS